jgi:ribosome-associated protein
MTDFDLRGEEFIELIRLLKLLRISETGGHAKLMVEDGLVKLNGQVEYRKRAKLRAGDTVEILIIKYGLYKPKSRLDRRLLLSLCLGGWVVGDAKRIPSSKDVFQN